MERCSKMIWPFWLKFVQFGQIVSIGGAKGKGDGLDFHHHEKMGKRTAMVTNDEHDEAKGLLFLWCKHLS
jgi:hypothetical protein